MIFPSCIWDISMNPNKRNPHQRNEKSEILEKEKSEVINSFSSRNCFLIKYSCLRWRMAIFHYPFTKMKLSASCPLLSLIISFINPDQGSSSTLEASTRKVLSRSWTIKFRCSKETYWAHPVESRNVQTQEKHRQEKTKARKRKEKGREWIPAEKWAPEIEQKDRRTKVRSKILHMMIFGPITLKTHFGPIILSFVTLSHGLRYVPEKPISIKHEYWN